MWREPGERHAQSLVERRLGDLCAERTSAPRLDRTEAELSEPRLDVANFGVVRWRSSVRGVFGRGRGLGAPRFGREAPALMPLVLHELATERAFRRVLIVRPSPQPHVDERSLAAARYLGDVIEFEPRTRRAALAGLTHERALAAVALPDRALDVRLRRQAAPERVARGRQ